MTNEYRNTENHQHRDNKNPERQDEIQNDAERNKSDEPSESVAPDKTAFHGSDIDLSTYLS